MSTPIPARISADGRVATWNPALTRAQRVLWFDPETGSRVEAT